MKLLQEDTRVGLSIAISALIYLFGYGSYVATIVEYYHLGHENPSMVGVFGAAVAFLSFGHLAAGIIFKLKLSKKDQPLRAAYFFPLIQLFRLVTIIRATCRFEGFKLLESEEKRTLFTVVTLGLDATPMLFLQFVIYFVKHAQGKTSSVVLLSLVTSFVSATYNGGMVLVSTSKDHAETLKRKAIVFSAGGSTVYELVRPLTNHLKSCAAGLNTLATLFLRCCTIAALILWKGWISPPSFITLALVSNFILFWKLLGWKLKLVRTFSAAYLTLCIGPLYPIASENSSTSTSTSTTRSLFKLLLIFIVHQMFQDVVVLLLSVKLEAPLHWSFYCKKLLTSPGHSAIFPCKLYIPLAIVAVLLCCESVLIYGITNLDSSTNREAGNMDEEQRVEIEIDEASSPSSSSSSGAAEVQPRIETNNSDDNRHIVVTFLAGLILVRLFQMRVYASAANATAECYSRRDDPTALFTPQPKLEPWMYKTRPRS